MRKQNVILTVWLCSPILIVVLLCYWIFVSLQNGPRMVAPHVGAGHGHTGGANAIGELLSESRLSKPVQIVIVDRTELASEDRPLLIGLEAQDWQGKPMTRQADGTWVWSGKARDVRFGFEISWIDDSGMILHDSRGRRALRISTGLQNEVLTELVP